MTTITPNTLEKASPEAIDQKINYLETYIHVLEEEIRTLNSYQPNKFLLTLHEGKGKKQDFLLATQLENGEVLELNFQGNEHIMDFATLVRVEKYLRNDYGEDLSIRPVADPIDMIQVKLSQFLYKKG